MLTQMVGMWGFPSRQQSQQNSSETNPIDNNNNSSNNNITNILQRTQDPSNSQPLSLNRDLAEVSSSPMPTATTGLGSAADNRTNDPFNLSNLFSSSMTTTTTSVANAAVAGTDAPPPPLPPPPHFTKKSQRHPVKRFTTPRKQPPRHHPTGGATTTGGGIGGGNKRRSMASLFHDSTYAELASPTSSIASTSPFPPSSARQQHQDDDPPNHTNTATTDLKNPNMMTVNAWSKQKKTTKDRRTPTTTRVPRLPKKNLSHRMNQAMVPSSTIPSIPSTHKTKSSRLTTTQRAVTTATTTTTSTAVGIQPTTIHPSKTAMINNVVAETNHGIEVSLDYTTAHGQTNVSSYADHHDDVDDDGYDEEDEEEDEDEDDDDNEQEENDEQPLLGRHRHRSQKSGDEDDDNKTHFPMEIDMTNQIRRKQKVFHMQFSTNFPVLPHRLQPSSATPLPITHHPNHNLNNNNNMIMTMMNMSPFLDHEDEIQQQSHVILPPMMRTNTTTANSTNHSSMTPGTSASSVISNTVSMHPRCHRVGLSFNHHHHHHSASTDNLNIAMSSSSSSSSSSSLSWVQQNLLLEQLPSTICMNEIMAVQEELQQMNAEIEALEEDVMELEQPSYLGGVGVQATSRANNNNTTTNQSLSHPFYSTFSHDTATDPKEVDVTVHNHDYPWDVRFYLRAKRRHSLTMDEQHKLQEMRGLCWTIHLSHRRTQEMFISQCSLKKGPTVAMTSSLMSAATPARLSSFQHIHSGILTITPQHCRPGGAGETIRHVALLSHEDGDGATHTATTTTNASAFFLSRDSGKSFSWGMLPNNLYRRVKLKQQQSQTSNRSQNSLWYLSTGSGGCYYAEFRSGECWWSHEDDDFHSIVQRWDVYRVAFGPMTYCTTLDHNSNISTTTATTKATAATTSHHFHPMSMLAAAAGTRRSFMSTSTATTTTTTTTTTLPLPSTITTSKQPPVPPQRLHSWVIVGRDGRSAWKNVPWRLHQLLESRLANGAAPAEVALGSGDSYFIRFLDGTIDYCLPARMAHVCENILQRGAMITDVVIHPNVSSDFVIRHTEFKSSS